MMDRFKKLMKLFYPPIWVIIPLVILCTVTLIYIFIGGYDTCPLAFVIYLLSAYTLTAVVMRCIKTIPNHYRTAKQKIYSNPIGERLMTDVPFRTHISLYGLLGINLLYSAFNIILGFMYHTAWFGVIAFYYINLSAMRFLLIRFINRIGIGNDRLKELKHSRLCGYILLTMNLFLSGAVLMIVYQNKGYKYHGVLIYIMAAYTFGITVFAIVNLVTYRKLGSPVMSMTKIISMASALVSMLSLETAMFSEFGGEMSADTQRLMIMLTGAGVSVVIIVMAVYSIVKNSIEIKSICK